MATPLSASHRQTKVRYEFGAFRLDPDFRVLFKDGQLVPLPPKALAVLLMLVEKRGDPLVEKEALLRAVWPGTFVEESNLTHHVSVVRKELGNGTSDQSYIETVPKRGYRFVAPVSETELPASGAQPAAQAQAKPLASLRTSRFALGAVLTAVAGLLAGAGWLAVRYARVEWARRHALPEMRRLVETSDLPQAFRLARQIERYLPDDPEVERLRRQHGAPIAIKTDPPGAGVYLKSYDHVKDQWEWLGKSPIQALSIPAATRPVFRLSVTKPGFETIERMIGWWPLDLKLLPVGTSPPAMVQVGSSAPLIPGVPGVQIPEYWIDKYEVSNEKYKRFIDAGGYRRREFWKHPFARNGRTLGWEEAMAEFRDMTGRPGPATWELGAYPEGQAEYPVGGISWYEAAAYAEFVGKTLPTIYHWYAAIETVHFFYPLVLHSNFAGRGPARIGAYPGLGLRGTYDMAGNVREWCFNAAGDTRYILGGAWNEQGYSCLDPMRVSAFDRSVINGLRCVKSRSATPEAASRPLEFQLRDVSKTKPVSEAVFQAYRAQYAYDRLIELQPAIEATEETPYCRRQKITFNAAYGRERVLAHLYLPNHTSPPYQAIVFCPGQLAVYTASSEGQFPAMLEFLIRSGRAVLFPVYKETYERRSGATYTVGDVEERDRVIYWAKDLSRSVDYLETRPDIDRNRLAFCGLSLGAYYAPVLTAVESRFKTNLLIAGGLIVQWTPPPVVDPFHFAPRNKVPTLMVNGRNDFLAPLDRSQVPLFRLLGASAQHKRHAILDGGHTPIRHHEMVRESLDWLDRYLGPVGHSTSEGQ